MAIGNEIYNNPKAECRIFLTFKVRNWIVSPTTSKHRKTRHPHFPTSYSERPAIEKSCRIQYNIRHHPAIGTLYRCSAEIDAYSLSMSTMIFRYSVQQPKWITVNNKKKLQGFHNKPTNMTATNTAAVSDRVLKTEGFNAIVEC